MEFARTELPHSGLLTTVPDCPYALLLSEVVKQHFCSRWCRWCPCSCYCFHPDPLLFPGARARSVSGCTDSNVTDPECGAVVCSCCRLPACLTSSLGTAPVGWPWGGSEGRRQGCSHGAGLAEVGGWLLSCREGQALMLWGLHCLRVLSFSDGLCVTDEVGSEE